jgi:hypothetical protein
MAQRGGVRPGAGRPTKADEAKAKYLAIKAIIAKYGSEEKGFAELLKTGEPSLVKWVFEHGYGKPIEKVDVTSDGEKIGGVQVEVLRAVNAHAEIAN